MKKESISETKLQLPRDWRSYMDNHCRQSPRFRVAKLPQNIAMMEEVIRRIIYMNEKNVTRQSHTSYLNLTQGLQCLANIILTDVILPLEGKQLDQTYDIANAIFGPFVGVAQQYTPDPISNIKRLQKELESFKKRYASPSQIKAFDTHVDKKRPSSARIK